MSEQKSIRRALPKRPIGLRQRIFRPVVTPDGQLQAGDCTLARVETTSDGGPVLVFRDRYRRRCEARGSEDIRVWLRELVDAVEGEERTNSERPLGAVEGEL
jgi:hypothetical protein